MTYCRETKQFVRILMYDLPLYLEKHNRKRTADEQSA